MITLPDHQLTSLPFGGVLPYPHAIANALVGASQSLANAISLLNKSGCFSDSSTSPRRKKVKSIPKRSSVQVIDPLIRPENLRRPWNNVLSTHSVEESGAKGMRDRIGIPKMRSKNGDCKPVRKGAKKKPLANPQKVGENMCDGANRNNVSLQCIAPDVLKADLCFNGAESSPSSVKYPPKQSDCGMQSSSLRERASLNAPENFKQQSGPEPCSILHPKKKRLAKSISPPSMITVQQNLPKKKAKNAKKSSPENVNSKSSPDNASAKNFPDNASAKNFPDNASAKNFPDNASAKNFPDNASDKNFPDNASDKNFPDNASDKSCSDNGNIICNRILSPRIISKFTSSSKSIEIAATQSKVNIFSETFSRDLCTIGTQMSASPPSRTRSLERTNRGSNPTTWNCMRPLSSPPSVYVGIDDYKRDGDGSPSLPSVGSTATMKHSRSSSTVTPVNYPSWQSLDLPKGHTALGKRLLKAANEGDIEEVRILLKHGVDPNFTFCSDWSPLHKAARKGHVEVMTLLLLYGAWVDARTHSGLTPLHLAARHDYTGRSLSKLLNARASCNAMDRAGDTPLHYAAESDNIKALRWLVVAGSDRNIRNNLGLSPLDVSASNAIRAELL